MLSIQHTMCGALTYATDKEFKDHLGALLLPDAIRAYTGHRQVSHLSSRQMVRMYHGCSFRMI